MNHQERLTRTEHVVGALGRSPLPGTQVKEALDALQHGTAELRKAVEVHEQAEVAWHASVARVNEATVAASTECKRGRAALVAQGVELAPHAADEPHTAAGTHARAAVILEKARASGVTLHALEARRRLLNEAIVESAAARSAQLSAATERLGAETEWQNAYAALRAAVEAALRKEGVATPLKKRLRAYFPVGSRGHPAGDEPAAPEEKKPAA